MDIYWHGQACFEIRVQSSFNNGKTKVVIDPYDSSVGFKMPSIEADLVLITHNDNNIRAIKGKPFIIKEPGEYEAKDIFIKGISAHHGNKGKEDPGKIVIYTLETEGIKICHLGDLGQKELTPEQVEEIGDVSILMIPVGGDYTIDGEEAQKIVNQIEPKIIIPMHYKIPKLKIKLDPVKDFLKAMGQEGIAEESSLKIKSINLPPEPKIVVLKP